MSDEDGELSVVAIGDGNRARASVQWCKSRQQRTRGRLALPQMPELQGHLSHMPRLP